MIKGLVMDYMKKLIFIVFVFVFVLCGYFINNKTSVLKEPTLYYDLPEVNTDNLDTSIEENNHLYPIEVNGFYGFIDVNGEMILEPKYFSYTTIGKGYYLASTVDENVVFDEKKYVDPTNGTYLISPNNNIIKLSETTAYMYLSVSKRFAIVYEDSGNYIFDLISQKALFDGEKSYNIIDAFDDFYIKMESELYYMTDYNGQNLSAGYEYYSGCIDDTIFFKNGEITYWLDKSGNPFFEYDNCMMPYPFYDGIAPVINNNLRLYFIDKDKNVLNYYDNVYSVSKADSIYYGYFSDYSIKIFDLKGNRKLSDEYVGEILSFDYNNKDNIITSYNKSTSTFYIFDQDGEVKESFKIPDGYTNPSLIYENYLRLEKGNNTTGLGLIKGDEIEWVIEPKEYSIYAEDQYIYVYSNTNRASGLYDMENKKFILEPNYLYITVYDKNMIYVESAYFKGYINSDGQFVYVASSYGF